MEVEHIEDNAIRKVAKAPIIHNQPLSCIYHLPPLGPIAVMESWLSTLM